MKYFRVSYLTSLWRRKSATTGAILVLLVLLMVLMSGDRRTEVDIQPNSEHLVRHQKRLQQTDEEFEHVKFITAATIESNRNLPQIPVNHLVHPQSDDAYQNKVLYEPVGKEIYQHLDHINKDDNSLILDYKEDDIEHNDNREEEARWFYKTDKDDNVEYQDQGTNIKPYGAAVGMIGADTMSGLNSNVPQKLFIPEQRLVHLDLKGAPPKMSYLKEVLTLSHQMGATGVLLEWEDMFPWSERLSVTAATNHYSVPEVMDLINFCAELGLEVIPLVQTFGHMEFILKHEEFVYLRDVTEMPESICPCHNDTMDLIKMVIDQMMAVHKNASYLHIGCDEVYHLGECQQCQGAGRSSVFVDHVTKVAKYVRSRYGVQPIIWDDMLRNMMQEEMQPLSGLVEPMVWVYAVDVSRFVPFWTWDRYSDVFDWIWTASAFKGAHGETLVVPDISKHLNNNLNWLQLMAEEQPKLKGGFRGIVLTGWQRYDHFAVLCELLPSGLPSLALNLLVVSHGFYNNSLAQPLYSNLSCAKHMKKYSTFIDLESDNYLWSKTDMCYFPGSKVFKMMKSLVTLETEMAEFLHKVQNKKGWMTAYNIRHKMSSPFRIDEGLENWSRYQYEVVSLMKTAKESLSEVFDHFTVAEWIEQKLYPMYKTLSKIRSDADDMRKVRDWPSRPYEPLEALKGLGIGIPDTVSAPLKSKDRKIKNPYLSSDPNQDSDNVPAAPEQESPYIVLNESGDRREVQKNAAQSQIV